jgi:hypothetical protein
MTTYRIKLIHRLYDWDAVLKFNAPDAKTARKWALQKMAEPDKWIVVKAGKLIGGAPE